MREEIMLGLLPQTANAPDSKILKKLPDLQREAEFNAMAEKINAAHVEIEQLANVLLQTGNEAIKRAIACGAWLRTIKAALKHGDFESWCAQHLTFKIRKAQYYMLLAQRHAASDILKLKPQSLRQALLYAGALPMDPEKRKRFRTFDECSRVRKTVGRLMSQLQSHTDPERLLRELEPLFQWREQVLAAYQSITATEVVVDAPSVVSTTSADAPVDSAPSKAQHDALLSSHADTASRAMKDTGTERSPAPQEGGEPTRRAAVLSDFQRGDPLRTIAERHHISQTTITTWRQEAGLPPRKQGMKT